MDGDFLLVGPVRNLTHLKDILNMLILTSIISVTDIFPNTQLLGKPHEIKIKDVEDELSAIIDWIVVSECNICIFLNYTLKKLNDKIVVKTKGMLKDYKNVVFCM